MPRKPKPAWEVKVVALGDRDRYAFRWLDDRGDWHQEQTKIPIGDTALRRARNRTKVDRLAVDFERELRARPRDNPQLVKQIDEFMTTLTAAGRCDTHLAEVRGRLLRFAAEARDSDGRPLDGVRSITESVIARFLNNLTTSPRVTRPPRLRKRGPRAGEPLPPPAPPPGPASIGTKNHYHNAVRMFCDYLRRAGLLTGNPAADIRRQSADLDQRHPRRTLSPEEFALLIAAAERGRSVDTVCGADRAMLYIMATWTGFRRKELAALTLRSFRLDDEVPAVRVKLIEAKSRREDWIPLHPALVVRFRAWLASRPIVSLDAPLFELRTRGGYFRCTAKMMRADLEAAGLPYKDEEGLFADFHANRAAFVTALDSADVTTLRVQLLARHTDPKTTAKYRKTRLGRLAEDVARLPDPPPASQPPDLRIG